MATNQSTAGLAKENEALKEEIRWLKQGLKTGLSLKESFRQMYLDQGIPADKAEQMATTAAEGR